MRRIHRNIIATAAAAAMLVVPTAGADALPTVRAERVAASPDPTDPEASGAPVPWPSPVAGSEHRGGKAANTRHGNGTVVWGRLSAPPASFRAPTYMPPGMPAPTQETPSVSAAGSPQPLSFEPMVVEQYCRDAYGHYYWMKVGSNPWACTLGYVRMYDSRNSSYLGAINIWDAYWRSGRSTALSTAWTWCKNNDICNIVAAGVIFEGLKRLWPLLIAAEL